MMIAENLIREDDSGSSDEVIHGTKNFQWTWFERIGDSFSTPEYIAAVIAFLFVVFGGVIKIRNAAIDLSTTTFFSVPSYTISNYDEAKNLKDWIINTVKDTYKSPPGVKICRSCPTRLWNFYVEAFMIPNYRKEWGKYKQWSFRSPPRPKKSPLLRAEIRRRKIEMQKKLEEIHDPGQPAPAPHNHADCQRVRINVGGCRYETQKRTLNRYPDTLLGDPTKRLKYYNPVNQEYFFDRNQVSFEIILYFYQSGGKLRRTENVNPDVLLDDAKFFGLPHGVVYQYLVEEGLTTSESAEDVFPINTFLRKIWLLFDYPESSTQARIVAIISMSSIGLSIAIFCIETFQFMTGKNYEDVDLSTGIAYNYEFNPLEIRDPFFLCETVCSSWFLLEYIARLFTCPKKSTFLKSYLNMIDLIAIVPYFFQLKTQTTQKTYQRNPTATFSVIRVIRLVRVFRIFKLSRHSRGLKILGRTLSASLNELLLLIFFVLIGVILFSSAIYFAELGNPKTNFTSIPEGFWWALITITTVGYGDDVPTSTWGKIVGALCAVAGVLTIALPVPVIVSNFNFFYHQAIGEQDLGWMKISHVPHCPFRPVDNFNGAPCAFRGEHIRPGMENYKRMDAESECTSDEEFGTLKKGPFTPAQTDKPKGRRYQRKQKKSAEPDDTKRNSDDKDQKKTKNVTDGKTILDKIFHA